MKQINLEFKQDGSVWVSNPVQMITANVAVQYNLSSAGTLNVEISSTGTDYFDFPDLKQTGQAGLFGISGGVNGLYVRFKASAKPNYISVTL